MTNHGRHPIQHGEGTASRRSVTLGIAVALGVSVWHPAMAAPSGYIKQAPAELRQLLRVSGRELGRAKINFKMARDKLPTSTSSSAGSNWTAAREAKINLYEGNAAFLGLKVEAAKQAAYRAQSEGRHADAAELEAKASQLDGEAKRNFVEGRRLRQRNTIEKLGGAVASPQWVRSTLQESLAVTPPAGPAQRLRLNKGLSAEIYQLAENDQLVIFRREGKPQDSSFRMRQVSWQLPDGTVEKSQAVQRGLDSKGRPVGFIVTESISPTGSRKTEYYGESASWVRRDEGMNRTMQHVQTQDSPPAKGSQRRVAGRQVLLTREDLGSALRTTFTRSTLLDDERHQRTTTYHADGRAERFEKYSNPDSTVEMVTRQGRDGTLRSEQRFWDPAQGLSITKWDAAGQAHTRHLEPDKADRLYSSVTRPLGQFRTYSDGGWETREKIYAENAVGKVTARGQDGKLISIDSGFVSKLGLPFGHVRQEIRPSRSSLKSQNPTAVRDYFAQPTAWMMSSVPVMPTGAITPTAEDFTRFADTIKIFERLLDRRPTHRDSVPPINYAPQDPNASALPIGNQPHIDVGPTVIQLSNPAVLGILGHEHRHMLDAKVFNDPRRTRNWTTEVLATMVGRTLEARVAQIENADRRRREERRADRSAGQLLAEAYHAGDKTMTTRDYNAYLSRNGEVDWDPVSNYDSTSQRAKTAQKGFEDRLARISRPAAGPAAEVTSRAKEGDRKRQPPLHDRLAQMLLKALGR